MEPAQGDSQEIMMRLLGMVKLILADGLFMRDGDIVGRD